MARPLKEGLDYFPHDTDAVNDEKIEALRALYGNDGYAFFFILLERIYRSPNAEIDVSDAETLQILARKVSVTQQVFSEMMKTALKWGCFDKQSYEERGVLTSNGVKKRASPVIEKRLKMKLRYEGMDAPIRTKRASGLFCIICGFEGAIDIHHSADGKVYPLCPNHHAIITRKLDTFENLIEKSEFVKKQGGLQILYQRLKNISDAETQNKRDKVKYSKVKKSKEENTKYILLKKKHGEFNNVLLSDDENQRLIGKFGEIGANERIERLSVGIESKGYKYKSHYAAILSWESRGKEPAKEDALTDKYKKQKFGHMVREG